jgi:hypothetical protein
MTHRYNVHPLQTAAEKKYREVEPDDWNALRSSELEVDI